MQITIFDEMYDNYKIKKPIRLIEFFAGVGSQAKSLERLNVKFENYMISEWDYNAIISYKNIHMRNNNIDYSKGLKKEELDDILYELGISSDGKEPMKMKQIKRLSYEKKKNIYNCIKQTNNFPNITKIKGKDLKIVDKDKYDYILTYSFPCQDLSSIGKREGMKKGSGTRSGLLWEVERILEECEQLPQILLMENVPEVIGKNNIKDFQMWQKKLEELGYKNYTKILNAKDYGIPQNRRRCFMVSILGDYNYNFPQKIKLKKFLEDIVEKNVDEKYFLTKNMINCFTNYKTKKFDRSKQFKIFDIKKDKIARTITTRAGNRAADNFLLDKKNNISKEPRKLTPLECFRLMGFDDEDYYNVRNFNSDAYLYKQMGNSIVVDVLYYIFKQML